MDDFKNCMLKFVKQEKQQQEDVKQQQKQRLKDFKSLLENIEWQEEGLGKLLQCLTKKTTQEI